MRLPEWPSAEKSLILPRLVMTNGFRTPNKKRWRVFSSCAWLSGDASGEPIPAGPRISEASFSFTEIRALYAANPGQANPSALEHWEEIDMNTLPTILELESKIYSDINRIKNTGPKNNQMAIIELVRTMDNYLLGTMFGKYKDDNFYIYYCYGWGLVMGAFLDESTDSRGVPLFSSNTMLQGWASSVLYDIGRLSFIKLYIDHSRTGLANIEKYSANEYLVRYSNQIKGVELIEREEISWLHTHLSEMQLPQYETMAKSAPEIHKTMRDNVFVWRDHFIGYNTTTEIDSFYSDLAFLEIQTTLGVDAFPLDSKFNGVSFEIYLEALTILKSFSKKHLGFVSDLLSKGIPLNSANLVQYFMLKDDIANHLSLALKIDNDLAREIIDLLVLSKEKKVYYRHKIDGAMAPFIKISRDHLLYSHAGFTAQPILFMLMEIRRLYQRDWDRALENREDIFRNELYSLFPSERFIKIKRPIVLKQKGRVLTDIDGLLFDKITGTLALFQLKWQEPFANSMFERSSRKKNFEHESNKWINIISQWLENSSTDELSAYFGLKKSELSGLNKTLLFVIGRNFSHFSGDSIPDERAAWGMWPQVLRLLKETTISEEDPIFWFYKLLKSDCPIKKAEEMLKLQTDFTMQMNGYTVKVLP